MKRIFTLIAAVILVLCAFLSYRALTFGVHQEAPEQSSGIILPEGPFAANLADALKIRTITHSDLNKVDWSAFEKLRSFLEGAFPLIHEQLDREIVGSHSLLYRWPGADTTLDPFLLMAHQDVVPISPGTEPDWTYPPFSGEVAEGFIWGRGAIDDKASLMGIFESVESLLAEGFQPRRTIYLAFGHDEEIGGENGAKAIADLLQSRGVRLDFVLDEGGVVAEGTMPGVAKSVALIGVAEKGYLNLKLVVKSEGGHSSMPPSQTAIGILSKAIARLEENPFPADTRYTAQMMAFIGPDLPFLQRLVFANLWLFDPLVKRTMSKTGRTNAGVRTTTAATIFNSGVKENVLPIEASAVVNFRILPGDTRESVTSRVRQVIDDRRVHIEELGFGTDPSPVSTTDTRGFELLRRTIHQVAGGEPLVLAPYVVVGGTDSRHFINITTNIYRFIFVVFGPDDVKRFHGTNERISIENYKKLIIFYRQLIRNSD